MKRIGFVAGNFDVIHPGYVTLFEEAKSNCDLLIVGLHIDPTIEKSGKLKPVLSAIERKQILYAMKNVDLVIEYHTEGDLLSILHHIKPDVRFLGEDYLDKKITGEELNIPIKYLSRSHGWSTTKYKKLIHDSINNI